MNFKIDDEILCSIGFVADTVADENLSGAKDETVVAASGSGGQILVTLGLSFCGLNARTKTPYSRMFAG